MRSHLIVFLFVSCAALSSCISVESAGFNNGYKSLTTEQQKQVVFLNDDESITELENQGIIYAVNGKQVAELMQSSDTTLVYFWGPNCTSDACVLVGACQQYCTEKNYQLVVVADHFDMDQMEVQNASYLPMLIANHVHYKKYYANALNKRFKKDLLGGQTLPREVDYYRYLFFSKGKLVGQKEKLFED